MIALDHIQEDYKTLEDSKGNVLAHKYMKIETAKEGRRLLLLESVEFQPETREDTPSSGYIKFHIRPRMDSLDTFCLWTLQISFSARVFDDLSKPMNPSWHWQRILEKRNYHMLFNREIIVKWYSFFFQLNKNKICLKNETY